MDKITKRIGFLLTAFVFFIFCRNCYFIIKYDGAATSVYFNLFLLVCTISFFASSFFNIGKYIQVFGLTFATLTSIFLDPHDSQTYSLLTLIVILMFKYGMLNRKPITKFSIYVSLILLTSIAGTLSPIRKTLRLKVEADNIWPIRPLVFFAFILSVIIIIFYDEIRIYIQNEKKLKSEIDNLNTTIEQNQGYIEKIEAKYIDPMKAGLTEAELELLKALCLYRESNTDLGKRLGKSPNTIKVQLSKILNKVSVETRHDLINHCRYHFVKNSEEETIKV